jgi:hypothetical protein
MAQGIPWDREKVMEVLKPYYKLGYSSTKACQYAGIPQPTVTEWLKNDPELLLKVTAWQNEVNTIARTNLVAKIDSGDENTSKWWLERKERDEMSPTANVDVTSKGERIEAGIFVGDFKDGNNS